MDSAAFSEITRHRDHRFSPDEYAAEVRRWSNNGCLLAAVTQDYMCEPHILEITGWRIEDHQELTIARYDAILMAGTEGVYLMPVLQGYKVQEYLNHIDMYGDRLKQGMWVGVGSICKRNGRPKEVAEILTAIKAKRPDLYLHGFGLKTTGLSDPDVRSLLYTADSMAWSFAARREGRNPNDWREALAFIERIEARIWLSLRSRGKK